MPCRSPIRLSAGADLALVRMDSGPAPFDHDFIDRDLIAVINLSDRTIDDVAIMIDAHGGPLLTRGTTARAADMPGVPLEGLAPGSVWITTVTEGNHAYEISAEGSLANGSVDQGEALYLSTHCVGDYNGDGMLNLFDVSAFLSGFTAQSPDADINADGAFNFFDVSAFLGAFAAGCS